LLSADEVIHPPTAIHAAKMYARRPVTVVRRNCPMLQAIIV